MSLVVTNKLRREYVRAGVPFAAVDSVTFSMNEGEAVSIVGRSGSGKTTFIGMVAGLISPTRGEVLLDGKEIATLSDAQASRLRNEVIGYVPQGASLLSSLTALDNVRLPRYLVGKSHDGSHPDECTTKALALLEEMNVASLKDAYPSAMSGGEMRRVAIARACITSPKLLIADEPTSDLDADSAKEVMDLLQRVNAQGTALLLVTHDADLAAIATRRLTMTSGTLRE